MSKLIVIEDPKPGQQMVYSEDGETIYNLSKPRYEYRGVILDPVYEREDGRIRVRWRWNEGTDDNGSCPPERCYYPPSYCVECEKPKTEPDDYLCSECRAKL